MVDQEPSIVVRGRTEDKYWNVVESGQYLFGSATSPFANR